MNPDTHELHYLNPTAALLYGLTQEYGYEAAMVVSGPRRLVQVLPEVDPPPGTLPSS